MAMNVCTCMRAEGVLFLIAQGSCHNANNKCDGHTALKAHTCRHISRDSGHACWRIERVGPHIGGPVISPDALGSEALQHINRSLAPGAVHGQCMHAD
eukprot:1157654-Pelagomonas_calceolata.AAC.10